MSPTHNQPIDPKVLEEAADWLTLLHCGEASLSDRHNLERWQHRSAMHQAAWQRAEAVMAHFNQVSAPLARGTLTRVDQLSRRQSLKALAVLLMATPAALLSLRQLPWLEWQSDLHTTTGEQKTVTLADGSQLQLNTATAVDIAFSDSQRRVTLKQGEIRITTGRDQAPAHRPFIVHTAHGTLRALGTRFSVRQMENDTLLAVFEGAVEIAPRHSATKVVVPAGTQRRFNESTLQAAQAAPDTSLLWQRGMLLAQGMPLGALIAELARYRRGILRCDPAVAQLTVSGAFPVGNTDASLNLLEKTLPVQISRISPWWTTIKARPYTGQPL